MRAEKDLLGELELESDTMNIKFLRQDREQMTINQSDLIGQIREII